MKKLTLKQKKFVRETIKTTNPTEAVRRTYNLAGKEGNNTKEQQTTIATTIASKNMTNVDIQREFREVLAQEIPKDKRGMLLKRNAEQSKNIPASNQAIDMMIKVEGDYQPEKHITANVNLTPANIDKKLEDLFNEYRKLQQEG